MSLDAELLARSGNEEGSSEGSGEGLKSNSSDEKNKEASERKPESLREAVVKAKAEENKKKTKEVAVESEKPSAIALSMANLLKSSWVNLLGSFGLTIFYINAHVILAKIFGDKVFCRLGDEWTLDKEAVAGGLGAKKKKTKMVNIFEPMGVVLVNVVMAFLVIGLIALIAMIANFVSSPLSALKEILKGTFSGWGK